MEGALEAQIEDEMEALRSSKRLSLKEAILRLASIGSHFPTYNPTFVPTFSPTEVPTTKPSVRPTKSPKYNPTRTPTSVPTEGPTFSPTEEPTISPTVTPSASPSFTPEPTASPTKETVPAAGSVVAFKLAQADKIKNCSSFLQDNIVITTLQAVVIASVADVGIFWKCVQGDGTTYYYNGTTGLFYRIGGRRRLFTEQLTVGLPSRRELQTVSVSDYTLFVNVSRVLPKNTPIEVVQQTQASLSQDIKTAFTDQTFTNTLAKQAAINVVPQLLNSSSNSAVQTLFIGDALVNPPTAAPTEAPTAPSAQPTVTVSNSPRYRPSKAPVTAKPSSSAPSVYPTVQPTEDPTAAPTAPSAIPTFSPSGPSIAPTFMPSEVPSVAPTNLPSVAPSGAPSIVPSGAPSVVPSAKPTRVPSAKPTTGVPTRKPTTSVPTGTPTVAPSAEPTTAVPTAQPTTAVPSVAPTTAPTGVPQLNVAILAASFANKNGIPTRKNSSSCDVIGYHSARVLNLIIQVENIGTGDFVVSPSDLTYEKCNKNVLSYPTFYSIKISNTKKTRAEKCISDTLNPKYTCASDTSQGISAQNYHVSHQYVDVSNSGLVAGQQYTVEVTVLPQNALLSAVSASFTITYTSSDTRRRNLRELKAAKSSSSPDPVYFSAGENTVL